MTRSLLALALLSVLTAGCGTAPSGLTPDAAFQASMDAVDRGEVPQALRLLNEAADAGHLGALAFRARAYEVGYLRTDGHDGWKPGKIEATHAFLVRPGQAEAMNAAYRDALQSAADGDDTDAMLQLASELTRPRWVEGDWVTTPSALDSARVIYDRLLALDADPYRLAFVARSLGLNSAYERHLQEAVDAGNPDACIHQTYLSDLPAFSARGLIQSIDAVEVCRGLAETHPSLVGVDQNDQRVAQLAAQIRGGNQAARVVMDSLRAAGVFERYPRLAAVVAG